MCRRKCTRRAPEQDEVCPPRRRPWPVIEQPRRSHARFAVVPGNVEHVPVVQEAVVTPAAKMFHTAFPENEFRLRAAAWHRGTPLAANNHRDLYCGGLDTGKIYERLGPARIDPQAHRRWHYLQGPSKLHGRRSRSGAKGSGRDLIKRGVRRSRLVTQDRRRATALGSAMLRWNHRWRL